MNVNTIFEAELAQAKAGKLDAGVFIERHYDHLMDLYDSEMPYGIQKARDGDPYEWLARRLGIS